MIEFEGTIEIGIGVKNYLRDGTSIEVIEKDKIDLAESAGDTAKHEAIHAAATNPENVELVSIIPGPGYYGITKLKHFDEVAAVAPHAYHMSGTGWDTFLVEVNGGNVDGSSAVARSRLRNEGQFIDVLSRRLEKVKSMDGKEVRKVHDYVTKGSEVEIKIKKPNGEFESHIKSDVRERLIVDFTNDVIGVAA
jgi:hypothetical protein